MKNAVTKPDAEDEGIRMGSEYSSAKAYLARVPRIVPLPGVRKKPDTGTDRGSNDSDFGVADHEQS